MNDVIRASFEAIDFQRGSTLLPDIAAVLDTVKKDPSKNNLIKAQEALHKVARKHTGMHFNFHFVKCGGPDAFVITPQADVATPMTSDAVFERVKKFNRPLSEKELFNGVVDIKTGKVSGIYSQIPIDVFIAIEFFRSRDLREMGGMHLAAILAHEMGHGFTYLRYLGKLTLSNVVISEITRRQHEGASDQEIQKVVKVAAQVTEWDLRDAGAIVNGTDPLIIQQIVMAGMVNSIRSELGTKFYDRRAFEFSADQFVARHGGATYIVESLDIMYKTYPQFLREYRGRKANIMASLVGYLKVLGGAGIATIGVLGTAPHVFLVGATMVISALLGDIDSGIYDPIEHRYAAMRRELIASSKDTNLTAKQRLEIINQIKVIDEIMDHVGKSGKGFFAPELISEFLVGIFQGRPGQQKFQRMLENMVNNRLFELSNKLQTV